MYIIGNMPSVLTTNRTMNQTRWAFLPARHRATPFHDIAHTTTRDVTNHITATFGKNGHTHSVGIFHLLIEMFYHPASSNPFRLTKLYLPGCSTSSCVSVSPSGNFSIGVSLTSCSLSPSLVNFLAASSYFRAACPICVPNVA